MAYYMLKRSDEGQCLIGDRCMVLADTGALTAGQKGRIIEIYEGGITIQFDKRVGDIKTIEGFERDHLNYLAWETRQVPWVCAEVERDTENLL